MTKEELRIKLGLAASNNTVSLVPASEEVTKAVYEHNHGQLNAGGHTDLTPDFDKKNCCCWCSFIGADNLCHNCSEDIYHSVVKINNNRNYVCKNFKLNEEIDG